MSGREYRPSEMIAVVVLALLSVGSTRADTVEELFDTDPGWSAFNLPFGNNDFGYRASSFAGADPGEAGGYFSAADQLSWYGDNTIGSFSASDAFRASGLMNTYNVDPDYNNTLFVGHFDSDSVSLVNGVGFEILEGSTADQPVDLASFRIYYRIGDTEGSLFDIENTQESRQWSYVYEPMDGDYGSLTVSISGSGGDTRTVFLSEAQRASITSLNAFGMANNAQPLQQSEQLELYIDDVTYSQEILPPERPDLALHKSVNNPSPEVDELVVFTIEVSNNGLREAEEVVVSDKLPGDMEIPEGMAAFTSAGYYEPTSGEWKPGALGVGQTETLTLPARITTWPQPVCVINTAEVTAAGDAIDGDNMDRVALRRPGIERCVDLRLTIKDWYQMKIYCNGKGSVQYAIEVSNAGPDVANNVVLDISDTLAQKPGYRISPSENCEEMRCTWPSIAAGASELVNVSTDTFDMLDNATQMIQLLLSSDQEDYAPDDNGLTEEKIIDAVSFDCPPPFQGSGGWDLSGIGPSCFIATATYGSDQHPNVRILREFRDNILLRFGWGRSMVELYYRYSPDIARYIAEREGLRLLTRAVLTPVVFIIAYTWEAVLLFLALAVMLVAILRLR